MSNLEVGIVGLPNVGKSTLFNAITKAGAEAANYPFCTIEPDARLKVLTDLYHSKKTTPASVRFVDIAGLVKGASKGEGLGNKFLEHIRQVDAVAHVVRCFESSDITHVEGGIDPLRDIDIIETELCLADLEAVEKRLVKVMKLLKSGSKEAKAEHAALERLKEALDAGRSAREVELSEEEQGILRDLNLLTRKPILYIANVGEDEAATADAENPHVQKVKEYAARTGAQTITRGTTAPKAAGKIHTDFERGFIRAEIVNYDDLVSLGSVAAARDKGLVRLEGKDYVMRDGDVVNFRFNV